MSYKARPPADELILEAAKAHTDLNVFYAVIHLMEGGLLSADSYVPAEHIIKQCRKAGERALRRYDRARDKLNSLTSAQVEGE